MTKLAEALFNREKNITIQIGQATLDDFMKTIYMEDPRLIHIVKGYTGKSYKSLKGNQVELNPDYSNIDSSEIHIIESVNEVDQLFEEATRKHQDHMYIVSKRNIIDELEEYFNHITNYHIYLNNYKSVLISTKMLGVYGYDIQIHYSCSKDQAIKQNQEMNGCINEIVKMVSKYGDEDWKKAILVVKYAVKYWKYNGQLGYKQYTAHSLIVNHEGVCMGISLAICAIFERLGIPVELVTGIRKEGHAWNKVYIAGGWFYIDVTDAIMAKHPFYHWGVTQFDDDRTFDNQEKDKLICNCDQSYIQSHL